jgi:hypothetical protein
MDGYVAFMDVLGFSSRVLRDASMEFFPEFTSLLEGTISSVADAEVDCIVSSDSIVVYSKDPGEDSLLATIKACSQLFFSLLGLDLPVRGCVSYGSYSRWETKYGAILAGRPVVDAYHYEEQQDWVGIMVGPSVIEKNPRIDLKQELVECDGASVALQIRHNCPWPMLIQKSSSIPFHDVNPPESYVYDGYAIVPSRQADANPEEGLETIELSIGHLRRLKSLAPDPQSQKKYASTIKWLEEVRRRWEEVISSPHWKEGVE